MSETKRKQYEAEFADYYDKHLKDDPAADFTTSEQVWIAAREYEEQSVR
jgi:hypothetical protein